MSGSGQGYPASGSGQTGAPVPASDPSMEDILASIRRILSEDDTLGVRKAGPMATPVAANGPGPNLASPAMQDEVLALDESMLVREPLATPPGGARPSLASLGSFMTQPEPQDEPPAPEPQPIAAPPSQILEPAPAPALAPPASGLQTSFAASTAAPMAVQPAQPAAQAPSAPPAEPQVSTLVAPEAAAAATASIGNLMRTLTAERHTAVYRGGPTLEDMAREEMRPMLKEWLDANLPGMVERIVRSEIERMAGRATL